MYLVGEFNTNNLIALNFIVQPAAMLSMYVM